jgi:hypothetical protein
LLFQITEPQLSLSSGSQACLLLEFGGLVSAVPGYASISKLILV